MKIRVTYSKYITLGEVKAVKAFAKEQKPELENIVRSRSAQLKKIIRSAPVADSAPVVHGSWVPFHSQAAGDIQYCSACEIGFAARMKYCPNCGAKMDLEESTDA